MPYVVAIPQAVSESNLVRFVEQLGIANGESDVVLDFQNVRFLIPGAIVALITKVRHWTGTGVRVRMRNHLTCPGTRYLQRMDFFNQCGIGIDEGFRRHAPGNRFVEVKQIAHGADRNVTDLSADIAGCFFPEEDDDEAWERGEAGACGYVEFAISELGNNLLQHSKAVGYLSAQYYPTADLVRIAIADCGIGIRKSFANSPFASEAGSDREAVLLALKPRVSSKEHLEVIKGTAVNRGVGLTFLRELAASAKGSFLVLSGNGYYSSGKQGTIAERCGFQGTFCALSVKRSEADRYSRLLNDAKRQLGLTSEPATYSGLFS
jgi:hypothetical protein